ncbi:DUF6925 family protein [Zavarzinia aquatilis]|uniref:Uncharacterized protein n=1 Tax=Zavarzinia aquatilis TaxID=2211142 RepID=A0A317DU54_9PROT|nr:hypothetical protein [Zavarzinia aquatilis]PWR18171.1 hypothetical protein DKG74_19650 [Zavarzinia aquatilis]
MTALVPGWRRDRPFDALAALLADPAMVWSMGFGHAVGRFAADGIPMAVTALPSTVTAIGAHGALRLVRRGGFRLLAYESLSADPVSWNHGIALCVPPLPTPRGLVRLGTDRGAILGPGVLYDLGLGDCRGRLCLRATTAEQARSLDRLIGQQVDPAALTGLGATWLFKSRAGRLELAVGQVPLLLPAGFGAGRRHAATLPLPRHLVPCGFLFPPPGAGRTKPFDPAEHQRFQDLYAVFGPRRLVRLKHAVLAALAAGQGPDAVSVPRDRFARACLRVTLRQQRRLAPSPRLDDWLVFHDRAAAASMIA